MLTSSTSEPAASNANAADGPAGQDDTYPEKVVALVGRLEAGEVPKNTELHFTADLNRRCGLIAVLSGRPETIVAKLWHHGQILNPLADFTPDGAMPRADVRPGYFSAGTLHEALAATRAIRTELRQLPAPAAREDQNAFTALALAATRGSAITAAWAPNRSEMVGYPLLAGMSRPRAMLENLADMGLITRRFFDRVHLCSGCAGARLIPREVCAACTGARLHEADLVHHYRCGYQGPRANFQRRDTHHLICPKCNRTVRHYGVDYDVPGQVTICLTCGETTSDPPVSLACGDCGVETAAEDSATRDWYHYDLAPAGHDAVRQGRLPTTDLSQMLAGREMPGHQAPRDLAVLLTYSRRVQARYERPFLVMTASPDLSAVPSVAERGRIYARLADVIGETLRDSDFVTVVDQEIVLFLPETPPDHAARVRERLAERLQSAMGENGRATIAEVDADSLDALTHRLHNA